ncbi:MAG: MerR family transcriptional regulator [Alphaproteobacteria bacterium]
MPAARQRVKSAAAFRTISEVSTDLDVPQHVLRFWESKFTAVRPLKRGGGRRYYRPEDVELLRRIRNLLYTDGYTIKGVQRLLREGHGKLEPEAGAPGTPPGGRTSAPAAPVALATSAGQRAALENVLAELVEIRDLLRGTKKG